MPTLLQAGSRQLDLEFLASLGGLDLKARYVMEGFLAGLHGSPAHGLSVEFSEYRRYQPGDDLRQLDWRLYARSDRMYIKRHRQETNLRCYLLCDTSASMAYQGRAAWASKFECAQVLAATLTWFLLRQNDAPGLLHLRETADQPSLLVPSQKPSQLGLLLREMETLQPAMKGACLGSLLQHAARCLHRRSLVLILSDLLEPSPEISLGLKQLRFLGHEVMVLQVLDRDEVEFPFSDDAIFEDLESGQRRAVPANGAVRAQYLARFAQFTTEWNQLFQQHEIPHCRFITDQDPATALARFVAERARLF